MTEQSDKEIGERTADGVRLLMDMDPSDRKAVLLAKWWHYGASSDPESMKVAQDYSTALVTVNANAHLQGQGVVIREAVEHEFRFQYEQGEGRETMRKLVERVENLEALIGQVLNRLPEDS